MKIKLIDSDHISEYFTEAIEFNSHLCAQTGNAKTVLFNSFPDLELCRYSCLLNDRFEGESEEMFILRVQEAIMTLIVPLAQQNNVFVSTHKSFLDAAYKIFKGKQLPEGGHQFTHEVYA